MESEVALTCTQIQTSTPSPPPDPESADPINTTQSHPPSFGIIIPNRIFVGGIDFKTNENDLRRFFSKLGAVKEVKIVTDYAGVSRGYGFVTFETQEDAQKVLHEVEADRLCFRDKRLNIGQAIRKSQGGMHANRFSGSYPNHAIAAPYSTMYLTTATGYPYTYHNGVAYFHTLDPNPPAPHWSSSLQSHHHHQPLSSSPVMMTQPVYQPPVYHHHQVPTQCIPGHLQWNFPQSPVPSSPVMYIQPSEHLYQAMEPVPDLPLVEATIPEQFVEHLVQQNYHQVYGQNAGGITPIIMQQELGKEQKFHTARQGFPSSPVSLKHRYSSRHYGHLRKNYRQDVTEPFPATSP